MNINVQDITITSIDTITAFEMVTGDYRFTLDELQSAKISQEQDTEDITGRNGRLLSTLKKNKSVTVSGDNGLVSGGLLEVQTGNNFERVAKAEVMWTDYLTVASNAATLSYTPKTAPAEIYVKNSDGTLGTRLVLQTTGTTPDSGKYLVKDTAVTFASGDNLSGDEIVAFYPREVSGMVHENDSEAYSTKCQLYIDCTGEDKCANVYHVQIYVPKADFDGNFELQMGDSQTVHSFEAKAQTGACAGNSANLWTWTVFADEETA